MADAQSPAVESLRKEQKSQAKTERELTPDQKLERALKDTFPASDPIAYTPQRAGKADQKLETHPTLRQKSRALLQRLKRRTAPGTRTAVSWKRPPSETGEH